MDLPGRRADAPCQSPTERAGLSQFDERIHRPGAISIDERRGPAVTDDNIPGRHITVADDALVAAQPPAEPGLPHGV